MFICFDMARDIVSQYKFFVNTNQRAIQRELLQADDQDDKAPAC